MFELKKIGIVKRASAWLLDAILLAVLTTGFMWIISLICGYEKEADLSVQYYGEWNTFRETYAQDVAEHFGYTYEEVDGVFIVRKEGQDASLDDVMGDLVETEGKDEAVAEAYAAYNALPPIATVDAQSRYVSNLLFMMVSVGLCLAYLILEFVVPIFFKNGQTIGKKVFGICLVRPDCVKISTLSLFARTVLGKYAIETMFPVLLVFLFLFGAMGWLAFVLLGALLILNIVLFFATKNRTPIHDILAFTVAVDMQLQMVYQSEEELNEKKALLQRKFIDNK